MIPNTRRLQETENDTGRERRGHQGDGGTNDGQTPQGKTRTWEKSEGSKGGLMDVGHGGRIRNAACGVKMSGRGWWL